MAIRIKVAQTPEECADVYTLRHQVYCIEENYFSNSLNNQVVDEIDHLPSTSNILVYINDTAVGTMRVAYTQDINTLSNPPEDFERFRLNLIKEDHLCNPTLISAGMLAISKPWRKRPEILFGLFRMATEQGILLGGTHVTALVNEKTLNLYKRLNWSVVGERVWLEEANEFCFPLVTSKKNMLAIAAGTKRDEHELLERLVAHTEWLISEPGDIIFSQGDEAAHLYLINAGEVELSSLDQNSPQNTERLILKKGHVLGFEAISGLEQHQYTAQTTKPSELFICDRKTVLAQCKKHPELHQAFVSLQSQSFINTSSTL